MLGCFFLFYICDWFVFKTEKKTEIKLDINLLSKTNKYITKQTNHKYKKERNNPT
jgi:hypothetical protein